MKSEFVSGDDTLKHFSDSSSSSSSDDDNSSIPDLRDIKYSQLILKYGPCPDVIPTHTSVRRSKTQKKNGIANPFCEFSATEDPRAKYQYYHASGEFYYNKVVKTLQPKWQSKPDHVPTAKDFETVYLYDEDILQPYTPPTWEEFTLREEAAHARGLRLVEIYKQYPQIKAINPTLEDKKLIESILTSEGYYDPDVYAGRRKL